MAEVTIAATLVADGLDSPLYVTAPAGDGRLFIVERAGTIKVLDPETGTLETFLDISGQVSISGEQGLLGLAFDPDYASNGVFVVDYTNLSGNTEIRAFRVSQDDPDRAETSGTLVLGIDQPFSNHNGGWVGFGPDGYLYVAMGDGGSAGDPQENAQNLDSLLGKILRLDISSDAFPDDASRFYAIPGDNPFVGQAGADEVWAYGLRNPWRASFDRASGTFYIADVGQNAWEEVDIGVAGGNYGWDAFEGPAQFEGGGAGNEIFPIASYSHQFGQSITGGYVYRGSSPVLQGAYFYADFISGRLWTLENTGGSWVSTERTDSIVTDTGSIDSPVSFGEDGFGNLYVVDFDGEIYRLTPELTEASDSTAEPAGLAACGTGGEAM